MNKSDVLLSLSKKQSVAKNKKEIASTKWKSLNDENISLAFRLHNNKDEVIEFILSKRVTKKTSPSSRNQIKKRITVAIEAYLAECEALGIDIKKAKAYTIQSKPSKTTQEIIESSFKSNRRQIDFFNLHSSRLKEDLLDIANGRENKHSLLREFEELKAIFMAKARGEIVVKSTTRTVEIMRDDDGNIISENTKLNSENKEIVIVETSSQLPSEKAFAAVMVISEVIETIKGSAGATATDDELHDQYKQRLLQSEIDKERVLNRVQNDSDYVVEVEDE